MAITPYLFIGGQNHRKWINVADCRTVKHAIEVGDHFEYEIYKRRKISLWGTEVDVFILAEMSTDDAMRELLTIDITDMPGADWTIKV